MPVFLLNQSETSKKKETHKDFLLLLPQIGISNVTPKAGVVHRQQTLLRSLSSDPLSRVWDADMGISSSLLGCWNQQQLPGALCGVLFPKYSLFCDLPAGGDVAGVDAGVTWAALVTCCALLPSSGEREHWIGSHQTAGKCPWAAVTGTGRGSLH